MSNHDLNQDNFETTLSGIHEKVLVDFWAPWCGPCRQLAPVVEELAKEFPGRVFKVNVDNASELAANFGIRSIPTIIIFKNGKPVDTLVGVHSKSTLEEKLN